MEYGVISAVSVSDCSFPPSPSAFVSLIFFLLFLFAFISDQRNEVTVFTPDLPLLSPPPLPSQWWLSWLHQIFHYFPLLPCFLPLHSHFMHHLFILHVIPPAISAIPVFIHSSHTLCLFQRPFISCSSTALSYAPIMRIYCQRNPSPLAGANNQSCFISSMTLNLSGTRSKQEAEERVHLHHHEMDHHYMNRMGAALCAIACVLCLGKSKTRRVTAGI